jgi:protein pelota
MKILKKDYKHGIIELIPENIDDLYGIYRILKPGDKVRASTSRRVRRKEDEGRADTGERVKMTLEVEVEELAFHGFGDNLRFKGTVIDGPDDLVSLGSYHTISLSLMEKVRIVKTDWTPMEKKVIDDIEKASMLAKIIVAVVEDNSICVALVTQFSTKIISEFSSSISRKYEDPKVHSSEVGQFFQDALQLIQDIVKQHETKVIILAGPGFTPENFHQFIKTRDQQLFEKVTRVHVSTGGRVGLKEVLSTKLPEKIANEQRVAYETRLIDEVLKRLGQDTGTVTYGIDNVKRALEMGAIDTLLISDDQISIEDLDKRKSIDEMVDVNSSMRGKTVLMSINHESGEQLSKLGGIAALLRYPLPD